MELLTSFRRINALLQKSPGKYINFDKMAEVLSDSLEANVLIISRRGRLLGYSENLLRTEPLEQILVKRQFPEEYSNYLLNFKETISNLDITSERTTVEMSHLFKNRCVTLVPIIGGEKRLGTIVAASSHSSFLDNDLFLAEYSATVVGIKMLHLLNEKQEEEARNQKLAHEVISSLSYSELEAVECIYNELKAKEGHLIASKVAEQLGISRSILVNAIRKLKAAGLVDSKSLGMKGTYIKILNDKLLSELKATKYSSRFYVLDMSEGAREAR